MTHFVHNKAFFNVFVMVFCKVFDFTCAFRGFHIYQKFWTPENGQLLNCFHESGSVLDHFAIKVWERNIEKPVRHLPREISRVTKSITVIIERGATAVVEWTSNTYRGSPFVQGGLEIKCKVTDKVPSTTPRQEVEGYCTVVEEFYVETKEEEILCLFILVNDSENMDEDFSIHQRSTRPKKQPSKPKKSTNKSKDIKIKKETL